MVDDSMWLEVDALPLELKFKLERLQRLMDNLDAEELRHVAKATLAHNFHLMHYAKTQVKRVEELEEEIRESQNDDFMEERATHFFTEITSILEYVPEGFELDSDEERAGSESEDAALEKDLADVEVDASTDEGEETLVADETMKWDEEEEEIFEED